MSYFNNSLLTFASQQGWDDRTQRELLLRFIEQHPEVQHEDFHDFLKAVQAEETNMAVKAIRNAEKLTDEQEEIT